MIEEGLYYLCSENKEADQLLSYCAADLHLCFRICKKLVLDYGLKKVLLPTPREFCRRSLS